MAQIKSFSMAIETSPTQAVGYYKRGFAYYTNEMFQEAIWDFTKACELDASYADSYSARANCFFMMGDTNGAIRDFRLAIEADPSKAENYYNLGNAEYTLGHWAEVKGSPQPACIVLACSALLRDPAGCDDVHPRCRYRRQLLRRVQQQVTHTPNHCHFPGTLLVAP